MDLQLLLLISTVGLVVVAQREEVDHDADSFHDDDQEGDNDGDVNGDGGKDEDEEGEEEKKDIFNKNYLFQSNRKMN